jgi:hypothetical protein
VKDKVVADKAAEPPVKSDRAAREATALRANLLKRKDQARRREAEAAKRTSAPKE